MIIRHHQSGPTLSSAVYSDCGSYRYALSRRWGPGPGLMYVLLNPSTATEAANDPTVERCQRRARALGFAAFRVTNLFAWRATVPATMKAAAEPVGPENDSILTEGAAWADVILCGWGAHGAHLQRGVAVAALLRGSGKPLVALGLTHGGHPRHPLYVGYATLPRCWQADGTLTPLSPPGAARARVSS